MIDKKRLNDLKHSKEVKELSKFEKRAMGNVWIRNIVFAVSLLIICLFVAQILLSVFTRHNRYKDVPDFKGIQLVDAQKMARHHRLRVEVNDSLYVPNYDGGIVLEQKPASGTQVKSGRRIFVTVNSFHQKMVTVPYVTGFSLRQAKNNLESVGLEIEELRFVEDLAANYVLGERVDGREVRSDSGIQVESGSGVVLTIGMNSENSAALMPDLTGLVLRDAKGRIWENGFNMGEIRFDDEIDLLEQSSAKVYKQSPQPGEFVAMGRKVTIYLTLDDNMIEDAAKQVRELKSRQTAERKKAMEEAALMESAQGEIESEIQKIAGE